MSKHYKLVDTVGPSCSKQTGTPTDWKLCVLCQAETSETLQCPANSTRKDVGAGYKYVAENLIKFQELDAIPVGVNVQHLNIDTGLEDTLYEQSAAWHKSCRNRISNDKLQRACKRKTEESHDPSPVKTRRSTSEHQQEQAKDVCIFCDNVAGTIGLHKASTFDVDFKVRKCATELGDTKLLAKLAGGDMVAIDAQYHAKCLATLYKHAQLSRKDLAESSESLLHGIAFAELVSYIETYRGSMEARPIFKMADLKNLYISRLKELGMNEVQVHTTRLKNRILAAIPDLRSQTEGREILLAYDEDIGAALKQACNEDCDSEALILAKTSKIIRRDVFKLTQSFNGHFPADCQEQAVPQSLTALVNMILTGPNINRDQSAQEKPTSYASKTISQLIVFNSVKSSTNQASSSSSHRHNRDRETPVSIYLALKIHGETRKKGLVDTLYSMGLCISYDRVLGISTDIANKVCAMYDEEGVVCPPKLSRNLFTVAAVDNIDHNMSSTTAKDSFHGTGISLMQKPSEEHDRKPRVIPVIGDNSEKRKRIQALPAAYTNVPPVALIRSDPVVPKSNGSVKRETPITAVELSKNNVWLEHVRELLSKPKLSKDDFLSWSAYHASLQQAITAPTTVVALMPLFLECAHSVTMIKHSMNVVKAATEYLNPGQIPVLVMDQPLFAIAKTIQWNFTATHGEDKYLIMAGGLHIEMTAFKVIGNWLDGSGWTTAICNAGIATSGVAESLLKATHVTRTRHAHQITVAALFILQHHAYDRYKETLLAGEDPLDFTDWCDKMSAEQPQFKYWSLVFEMELCILQIIKSIRKGNFLSYLDSLVLFIPWVFSLDHINYARWLSVHIRDMLSLSEMHPAIYQEFIAGAFVAHKTKRPFSAMALDQAHEQVNALVKGEGGAVGLTDNPNALQCWMVAGPEISRMVAEFEDSTIHGSTKHHEQTTAVQTSFAKEVTALVAVFEEMGNPFKEDSGDLLTLDTKLIMDSDVHKIVANVYKVGQEQYDLFVKERFVDQTKSIKDPIKKNKLQVFSRSPKKQKSQVVTIKEDCTLFSRLYIACQSREGKLEDFFKHENQPWPPSLSKSGDMRSGNKADLLAELEALARPVEASPQVTALILDGPVIVQMLSPRNSQTFEDYTKTVFMPYIQHQLERADRIDIVWDVYNQNSLKAATREKRGKGVRRRVELSSKVPSNWQSFLRVNENKTELFHLLAEEATSTDFPGKEVYSTYGDQVLSSPRRDDKARIEPCSHEEADTRLVLHLFDAAHDGHEKIMVRTSDTDVVVLILSKLPSIPVVREVWISFGVGSHHRYIAAHAIAATLGPSKAPALAMFHAFTGSDATSFFAGKGKRTAWNTWSVFPDVTDAFLLLADAPPSIPDSTFDLLEKYVVLLYDKTCGLSKVDEARQHLFARRSRALENIPPTQAALKQHALRAVYQGGHVWGQVLQKEPRLPSPADWGWDQSDGSWKPKWTTIGQAQDTCYELIHCNCRKVCRGLCKCYKASLQCTALCRCEGNCYQE